jgi:gas vesicle protein
MKLMAAALAMFGAVAITACDNDSDLEDAVEDAADEVEDAADEVGDEIEEAAEEVEDEVNGDGD